MTYELLIAGAALALAGLIAWASVLIDQGGRRPAGCRRRGCRPEAGWHGCDHGRPADGSAAGLHHGRD